MPDEGAEIRSHIDAAHAAAEKLVREAEERARESSGVPPRGWDVPPAPAEDRSGFPELHALVGLLDSVRSSIPPELTTQVADALRELLVALRALIDWYIDRLERFTPGPSAPREPRVQDIPID